MCVVNEKDDVINLGSFWGVPFNLALDTGHFSHFALIGPFTNYLYHFILFIFQVFFFVFSVLKVDWLGFLVVIRT